MQNRRHFVRTAAATSLVANLKAANKESGKLRVGVMGLSRGKAHINNFAKLEGVEIAYVCDVDQNRLAAGAKYAAERQNGKAPKAVTDFRRILEDKDIDILSIAAPNFWHAPATILACEAGKHVYVEKPGSHNPREAELMVEVARRTSKKVQMGNQRRSAPGFREGIEKLHSGIIGPLRYARCWYDNARKSIGKGKPVPVPSHLDYALWQGPAPARPYKDNLVHYNWHWHWHYGGGELANNGVHALDIARWALGVDLPKTSSYTGGRYHFDDDQETPDTADATYDYGKVGMSWHGSSCLRRKHEKHSFVSVYGDGGVMSFDGGGYRIHDNDGKLVEENVPGLNDLPHFQNFVNAIRNGEALNAEISDAQKSTMLCHLGNISYREGRQIHGMEIPDQLRTRQYSRAWKPKGL
ncbi:MAG: Gfo/Idh/MocA family protein [Akkermansiaceae bacterium]